MLHCGERLQQGGGTVPRMPAMNPDRRIYITTAVLAVVLTAAINVLTPRDPFAGTIVHREPAGVSRTAQASPPQAVEVSSAPSQPRTGTSL
jgi:hypothetical protein